jgi:hypothetical protein
VLSVVLSAAIGLFLSLYGLAVGIVGIGPVGPVPPQWRAIGCGAFILGALYFLPKRWIRRHRPLMLGYCVVTLLPLLLLVGYAVVDILRNGPGQFVSSNGLTTSLVLVVLMILGPLPVFLAKTD